MKSKSINEHFALAKSRATFFRPKGQKGDGMLLNDNFVNQNLGLLKLQNDNFTNQNLIIISSIRTY
jgi:hypothetical protein